MAEPSRRPVLAAAGTVAGSLLFLIGVPLALVAVAGWSLPRSMPSMSELGDAFRRQGVPVEVVINLLALVIWFAWSQVAWATVVETVAYARGRVAGRTGVVVPGARLAAHRLVAAVAFLVTTLGSPRAAPATPDAQPLVVASVVVDHVAPAPPVTARPAAGRGSEEPAVERIHEVERGDTFWALAERYLGSGARWREIRDHNAGRAIAPGRVLGATEDALDVGWRLAIPGSRPPAEPGDSTGATDSAAPSEVTIRPGDSLWDVAERNLEAVHAGPADVDTVRAHWSDVVEVNRHRLVDRMNPDLIHSGQRIVLPPVAGVGPASVASPPPSSPPPLPPAQSAPPPLVEPEGEAPVVPTPEDPAPRTPPDGDAPIADPDDDETPDAPVAVLAGATTAALAVGVTRAIRRRRRRRDHRSPRTTPVPPIDDDDVHRRLVVDADEDLIDRVGRSIDQLARHIATAGQAVRPRILQASPDHLDVLLDAPALPAPPGWEAQADGAIWTLDADDWTRLHPAAEPLCPAPLLVTVGQPDEGGQLYLDLETAGTVTLDGDREAARALARAMLTELEHSPFAATAQIVVVGDLAGDALSAFERVDRVDRWEDVADDLRAWVAQSRDALDANGWPNPFAARGHGADHDALIPLVVIADEPPAADLQDAVTAGAAAAAIVSIGPPLAAGTVIDCQPDRLSLPQLGLTCRPQVIDEGEVSAIADLLSDAENPPTEQLTFDPVTTAPAADAEPAAPAPAPYIDRPYEILVRYLGDITVDGGTRPLTAKQTALVSYIALHRSVSADRVIDAVWANASAVSPRKLLANTITKCRRALGTEHLPVAQDNRYSIGPDVATDIELFDARIAAAAQASPAGAIAILRGALDLVRGPIFEYPGTERDSYAWVAVENWISTWELKVTATAQRAAELCLDVGAPTDAADIGERMLRVVPTHPGLTEILMRAHAVNGDRTAMQRVYQAHVKALEQLDLDTVAESTATLYDRLRAG